MSLSDSRAERAVAIAAAGDFEAALTGGSLPRFVDTTVSEALLLGLIRQNVRVFFTVLGHGSTEFGEVLRVYSDAGLVRVCNVRSEIEASHAAVALRWVSGERSAVVTSIGPGALQALAASIVAASDGVGVWYLFGDETSEDEGPNMQQIPRPEQALFLRLCSTMGRAYTLHTPLALPTALRRGLNTVDHPYRAGPFFLLMPMNTQAITLDGFNLDELPAGVAPAPGAAAGEDLYDEAAVLLMRAQRVLVKAGGGARHAGAVLQEFLDLVDGVVVTTPVATGAVPYSNPRHMAVGGSKGSLCGNYAMEHADLLVAIGTRAVCQSDCSRTGYPGVQQVININPDLEDALHYGKTLALVGDAAATLDRLNAKLRARHGSISGPGAGPQGATVLPGPSPWLSDCTARRQAWQAHKARRYACPMLYDEIWGESVLTQPAAIKIALDWAKGHSAVTFFDAGDVQANGFQIVEDERIGQIFTEAGASYMGFAASALLATAVASPSFYGLAITGDGSFTMSPQVLIDGAHHAARGCILLLDNRRMAAISGLQIAQYGHAFATGDGLPVDYAAWARAVAGVRAFEARSPESLAAALDEAGILPGLALIHVPVYYGPDELGGLGVFGRWNVGNWCAETQTLRHQIGL